jgi:hypothetical protein
LNPKEFGLQEDNVMLEFNIPPAPRADMFEGYMSMARNELGSLVHTISEGALEVAPVPFAAFPQDELVHPRARLFGCSPDFDAHANGQPLDPIPMESLVREDGREWRFAGGHVHLGYNNKNDIPPFVVAAFADVIIGLDSLSWDKQGERRKFYGTAGRYRPTPYGIEYRVLSNRWVYDYCYEVGRGAERIGSLLANVPLTIVQDLYIQTSWGDVKAAINEENRTLAQQLADDFYTRVSEYIEW